MTFRNGVDAGIILHYQDPENFMVALLDDNGSGTVTPRLVRYINGDKQASLAAGSTFNLTDTSTYTVKAVVNDDPGNAALQELNLYVGGTLRLTTTDIDASWPAGLVGLFRTTNTTTTLQWDDFICALDKDVDGTIGTVGSPDAGDWIFAAYDFNDPGGGATWQKLALSYDNNGNVTNDGLLESAYDAWNRCVRRGHKDCNITDPNQATMKFTHLAYGREITKVVQNRGTEVVANDGGNLSLVYLRDRMARSSEERNGSNQTVRQFINGLDYGPCLAMDVNGDPTVSSDSNIDNNDGSEGSESPSDARYFVHTASRTRRAAITTYFSDPNDTLNGTIQERYAASRSTTLLGDAERGTARLFSTIGLTNSLGNDEWHSPCMDLVYYAIQTDPLVQYVIFMLMSNGCPLPDIKCMPQGMGNCDNSDAYYDPFNGRGNTVFVCENQGCTESPERMGTCLVHELLRSLWFCLTQPRYRDYTCENSIREHWAILQFEQHHPGIQYSDPCHELCCYCGAAARRTACRQKGDTYEDTTTRCFDTVTSIVPECNCSCYFVDSERTTK